MWPFILWSIWLNGLSEAYTVTNTDLFMFKNIDPIVLPGQYTSHMHSFFGSDAVTVNTTTSAELQKGCSSTDNPNDFSTYWVPTLYLVENGNYTPINPMRFSAYYENLQYAEIAIPQNFTDVAGNSSARSQSDVESNAGIQWFCEGESKGEDEDAAAFPLKTCGTHLQTLLLFHDCVNPKTLESAYNENPNWYPSYGKNRCPKGMYRIPQLRLSIRYDLRELLPDGWEGKPPLQPSCGPSYCSHGDVINGWLPEAAENMVNGTAGFFPINGPLGAYNAGSVCGAENAHDRDPTHGTSDYKQSLLMMKSSSTTKRHLARHRHWT
ncbi:hypothetical protein N7462_000386 [Penicillium macrosclerotiorum]|uniref:uncharacterized protein n=1 Tax=Penicillium macrosclerotiorum TaxID=303699 RepID=UPI0025497DA1|nr:uncharacterized protein N7462_000386 [Penicillium macrosclerotiorum]KAJ5698381.1 hypothetical protein N7462_000386 [Penicillium macrosclerotiorum]